MDTLIRSRVAGSVSNYRRALTLCGAESSLPRQGVLLTRSCGGPYRVMACEQDIADHSCSQQRTVKASP